METTSDLLAKRPTRKLWIIIPDSSLVPFPCDGPLIMSSLVYGYLLWLFIMVILLLVDNLILNRVRCDCMGDARSRCTCSFRLSPSPFEHLQAIFLLFLMFSLHITSSSALRDTPGGTGILRLNQLLLSVVFSDSISMLLLWHYHSEEVPYLFLVLFSYKLLLIFILRF